MKFGIICLFFLQTAAGGGPATAEGTASWYGNDHRGKLMANGQPFNPDKLTAASWDYALGSRVWVSDSTGHKVEVTITDRGPARRLVRQGRIIDLSRAAFEALAGPELGLVHVTIEVINPHPVLETARGKERNTRLQVRE